MQIALSGDVNAVQWDWKLYAPLFLVLMLTLVIRIFSRFIPDIGMPLIFVLGGVAGLFTGRRINAVGAAYRALLMALPVLGLLAGIGMFLQVMTLTGVRGLLVVAVLGLPAALDFRRDAGQPSGVRRGVGVRL